MTRPRAAWMQVLEQIEVTLNQSLALAGEPALALPGRANTRKSAEGGPLQVLDDRLARWQTCIDQARANAAEADSLLATGCQELQAWLTEMRDARQRLADWVQRAV